MKQFIKHRVNKISDLTVVDPAWGVEIDLRSNVSAPGKIHLSHDPWNIGDDFEDWARRFRELGINGPIILNTKEDGLETRAREILSANGCELFFFLDTALPTLIKWTLFDGYTDFAVRISAYEPIASTESFVGKANWVWADCFAGIPISPLLMTKLKEDFKICLVSPELQGQALEKHIEKFRQIYEIADAICTKTPDLWLQHFKKF